MTANAPPKDFGFGSDEEMLRDVARQFLDEHLPVETLRNLVAPDPESVYERGEPTRWDPALWKRIVELGWKTHVHGEGPHFRMAREAIEAAYKDNPKQDDQSLPAFVVIDENTPPAVPRSDGPVQTRTLGRGQRDRRRGPADHGRQSPRHGG